MKQYTQLNETMIQSNKNYDFNDDDDFDIIIGKKNPIILNRNTGESVEVVKKTNLKKICLPPQPTEIEPPEEKEIPIPEFSEVDIDEFIWKQTRFQLNYKNVLKCEKMEISFNFVSLRKQNGDTKPNFASMLTKKTTTVEKIYDPDEYDSDEEFSLDKKIEEPKIFSWKKIELPIENIYKIEENSTAANEEIDDGFIRAGKKNKKKEKKNIIQNQNNNVIFPMFTFPQLFEKKQIQQKTETKEILFPILQSTDDFIQVGKKGKKNIQKDIQTNFEPEKKVIFKIRNTNFTTEHAINLTQINYHERPPPEKFKTLCSSVFCTKGINCPFSHNIFTESKIGKCFKKIQNPNEKSCEQSCKFKHPSEDLMQYAKRLLPTILFDQFGNHFFMPEQFKKQNVKTKNSNEITLENFIQKKQLKK